MADRPILFSAPMVRVLLDGRKTQTRRILGSDPRKVYGELRDHINGPGAWEANPWVVAVAFTVGHHNIDGETPT